MKTFTLSFLLMGAVVFTSCAGGKKNVSMAELPAKLQTLISQDFSDEQLSYATVEREDFSKKYEIVLSGGTEIEADGDGDWYEIKCRGKAVPSGVLPSQIRDYISAKHPETMVVKIDRKRKGYEIELANGLEIKFDNNFIVREYDS